MNNSSVSTLRGVFAVLLISVTTAVTSHAADPKPPSAKVLEKYDTNKDGKLDEAETAKWNAAKKAAADKKAGEKKPAAE